MSILKACEYTEKACEYTEKACEYTEKASEYTESILRKSSGAYLVTLRVRVTPVVLISIMASECSKDSVTSPLISMM